MRSGTQHPLTHWPHNCVLSVSSADSTVGARPAAGNEIRWDAGDRGVGSLSSLGSPLTSPAGEGPWGQRAGRLGRALQPLTPPAAALRDPEAWVERAARDSGTCGASPRSVAGSCLPLQRLPTPLWVPDPDLSGQHQLQPSLLLASQRTQPVRGASQAWRARFLSPPCPQRPWVCRPPRAGDTASYSSTLHGPENTLSPALKPNVATDSAVASAVASSTASTLTSPVASTLTSPVASPWPLLWPPPWPPPWPPL